MIAARCLSLFALACLGVLAACDGSFEATYASSIKGMSGQVLYDELLRLDQAYPNRIGPKLDLGARLLSAGEYKGAKAYLDRAEKLLGPFTEARYKYALFADQAELKLREGAYKESLAYATKAISASPKDELGVVFTKAKAESAIRDRSAALEDFGRGWISSRASMSVEDYRSYISALSLAGRDADEIQVLREYQKNHPYDPGVGLLESGCYKRLGDFGAAILCTFKEYEHGRASGAFSEIALAEALDAVMGKGEPKPPSPMKELKSLIASLKAFVGGDWKAGAGVPELGFGEYVALASRLEGGSASSSDLERYLLLEPSFKSFQSYYYHLWRGMRKDARSYSIKAARPILEKCVALSLASSMALESRRELGRLMGVGEASGGKLLVPAEIDAIFADLIAGAPFSRLEGVMATLDTPDNEYQFACVCALRRLSSDPAMRAYLETKANASSGKLRERLTYALSL
jgi:tetratricopeptide (TPR) repeat protein